MRRALGFSVLRFGYINSKSVFVFVLFLKQRVFFGFEIAVAVSSLFSLQFSVCGDTKSSCKFWLFAWLVARPLYFCTGNPCKFTAYNLHCKPEP